MTIDLRPHHRQLFRTRIRQRGEQDGIDHAEDRGVGSDAQHEREQCDGGESRSSTKPSERIANVAPGSLYQIDASRLATLFGRALEAAELQPRLSSGLSCL